MAYLFFPGRHLANTAFQDTYLRAVLGAPLGSLQFVDNAAPTFTEPLTTLVFAITSANQQHARYNPVPYHIRAIGVDRFGGEYRQAFGLSYRIFGIPHYPPNARFARTVLGEIEAQSEGELLLTPQNTAVLCSTPALIAQYRALGFSVLPAEADTDFCAALRLPVAPPTPIQLIERLVTVGDSWADDRHLRTHLAPATYALWRDFPEAPQRILRLWRDPLLTDSGSLTETRNYSTYTYQMSNPAILELKYQDVRQTLVEGRIVDEGCADGALLVPIARDFPDSDLIGIDITAEFLARATERQRAGEYGGTFVHFFQRNILQPIFEPQSLQTTLCNSTAHELWSYGHQAETLAQYLQLKFEQTAPGGRIVLRDVVGVETPDLPVRLYLPDTDGTNEAPLTAPVETLSSRARFLRFVQDFLPQRGLAPIAYQTLTHNGKPYYQLRLKDAHEYLMHKDYTDNWASEMQEEFGFWSFTQWQRALEAAGFEVVLHPTLPERGSRVYANPWIIANRWEGQIELLYETANGWVPLPWPVTTMVLVGQRAAKQYDYNDLG